MQSNLKLILKNITIMLIFYGSTFRTHSVHLWFISRLYSVSQVKKVPHLTMNLQLMPKKPTSCRVGAGMSWLGKKIIAGTQNIHFPWDCHISWVHFSGSCCWECATDHTDKTWQFHHININIFTWVIPAVLPKPKWIHMLFSLEFPWNVLVFFLF